MSHIPSETQYRMKNGRSKIVVASGDAWGSAPIRSLDYQDRRWVDVVDVAAYVERQVNDINNRLKEMGVDVSLHEVTAFLRSIEPKPET